MHDEEIDLIVFNAFNGLGDTTGSDEFGISVAWLDLADYLEDPECRRDSDELTMLLMAYMSEHRYVLAFIDANGVRSALAFDSFEDMMREFRQYEEEYLQFEDAQEEDV